MAVRSFFVLAAVVLTAAAWRADVTAPGARPATTMLDLAVGLAFLAAAWRQPATTRPLSRALVASVGATWLIASVAPDARLVHQALLATLLVTFPTGRVMRPAEGLLVVLAIPVGLSLTSQPIAAALFIAIAGDALGTHQPRRVVSWYPAATGLAVAAVLAGSWAQSRWVPDSFDPDVVLVVYEGLLLLIAATFPFVQRLVAHEQASLVDRLLTGNETLGLDGLAAVLGDALRAPSLCVHRWDDALGAYVDADGRVAVRPRDRSWFEVHDGGDPVAAVEHDRGALDDADAVAAAVRLAVENLRLQDHLDAQLDELEAARRRLLDVADRQREASAGRLHDDVLVPLHRATAVARAMEDGVADDEARAALRVVTEELGAAAKELEDHVAGVPPTRLGSGRLADAVRAVAARSPVSVNVTATPTAAADPATESALFYVCSEALANAVKHAEASRVDVAIRTQGGDVVVVVSDDGRGGADPTGSGLQGLADRVAARGGRLRVESPPGAGTVLTATVPVGTAPVGTAL